MLAGMSLSHGNSLTQIIGLAICVHTSLGHGLLESIY
jgi:hypothetical protein